MNDYPKIYRIPLGKKAIGKDYLSPNHAKEILFDEFDLADLIIEEKIDGKTDIHCLSVDSDFIVFGECMKWKHSIPYDKLPAWFVAFDVYSKPQEKFLNYDAKSMLLKQWGFTQVPLIYRGKVEKIEDFEQFLDNKSMFATDQMIEGIVIKNYSRQLFAKIVRTEFLEGITDHWMLRKRVPNRLDLTHKTKV